MKKYISDSTTYFLPILGQHILGMDNGKILSALPSKQFVDLVNNQIKHGINGRTYPSSIKDIYNQGNDQNPVLLLTAFKKEIHYDTTF
ncbi:MAG TPA: hypothetical protein PKA53_12230 [Sphingobacterium sp.]|nr:hypothetical protein [Sphingobacterium sp.]